MKKLKRLFITILIIEIIVIAWGIKVGLYDDSLIVMTCRKLFQ